MKAGEHRRIFGEVRVQGLDGGLAHRRAHLLFSGVDDTHAAFTQHTSHPKAATYEAPNPLAFGLMREWHAASRAKPGVVQVLVPATLALHDRPQCLPRRSPVQTRRRKRLCLPRPSRLGREWAAVTLLRLALLACGGRRWWPCQGEALVGLAVDELETIRTLDERHSNRHVGGEPLFDGLAAFGPQQGNLEAQALDQLGTQPKFGGEPPHAPGRRLGGREGDTPALEQAQVPILEPQEKLDLLRGAGRRWVRRLMRGRRWLGLGCLGGRRGVTRRRLAFDG